MEQISKEKVNILARWITDNLLLVLFESNHLCEEYYIFFFKGEGNLFTEICVQFHAIRSKKT